jgi:hypothetical protein
MKKTGENAKLQNQIKIQYSKAIQFQAAKIEPKNEKINIDKQGLPLFKINVKNVEYLERVKS